MEFQISKYGNLIYNDSIIVNQIDGDVNFELFKQFQNNGGTIETTDFFLLEEEVAIKTPEYRKNIYQLYDSLYTSSLARALGKVGQGLTISQLERLKIGYEQKRDIALEYITNNNILNETLFSTIEFELLNDYNGSKLDNEITMLNYFLASKSKPLIPIENKIRIQLYCYLIITKYSIGNEYWEVLKAYCENFRSVLITNLDNSEFERIDNRIALVKTIDNNTSIEEIANLKIQFDNL